ncbi:MAG: sensor histidine kinase [Bacteroidales bacterium]
MQNNIDLTFLSDWKDEINVSLMKNNSFCVALFSDDGTLLFANTPMLALFKGEPFKSLINPDFERLLSIDYSIPLIFDGFLTLGDYSSVNSSIMAQVYRKKNKLLILGGIDALQLLDQNTSMHQLNQEISKLQRQLLKEKHVLEITLKQLNDANNSLKQLNATKDKFFSIIAHDLRSPFTSFLGLTQIMSEEISNLTMAEIQKFSSSMEKSAQNLFRLLENLLEWAKMNQQLISFSFEKIHLLSFVSEIVENLMESANYKRIKIDCIIPEDIEALADINSLQTVFRNLISNAIKFTPKDGKIIISAKSILDNMVEISIKDTGIGMKKAMMDELFKLEVNTSRKGTEGELSSGLGLLLCKEFIEKNGGKLWVESEEGKGSSFYFTLKAYETYN